MKKLISLLLLSVGLMVSLKLVAQKKGVTTQTATKSKGYTIINSGEQPITIYKYVPGLYPPKEAEKNAPQYFFATKSSDELKELTKENLKSAFPDKHTFHDALDATFPKDDDLMTYDKFHKMYKINHLVSAK
ncbi:MAG: hypothetical protein ABIN89_20505 [Chitinophagaceae bacterium]